MMLWSNPGVLGLMIDILILDVELPMGDGPRDMRRAR